MAEEKSNRAEESLLAKAAVWAKDRWQRLTKNGPYTPHRHNPRDTLSVVIERLLEKEGHVTASTLEYNSDKRTEIEEFLVEKGIRSLPTKGEEGRTAITLKLIQNQYLRISDKSREGARIKEPEMLQPLLILKRFDDHFVSVVPEVFKEGITQEHIDDLTTSLAKKGYLFWDARPENVGLLELKDGQKIPVVLDAGAVVHIEEKDQEPHGQAETHIEVFGRAVMYTKKKLSGDNSLPNRVDDPQAYFEMLKNRPQPNYNWAGAQAEHVEKLGLKYGEVAGVFSADDVKRLQGVRGGRTDGVIARAIVDGGLYRQELSDAAERATERFMQEEDPKSEQWQQFLKEEIKNRDRVIR